MQTGNCSSYANRTMRVYCLEKIKVSLNQKTKLRMGILVKTGLKSAYWALVSVLAIFSYSAPRMLSELRPFKPETGRILCGESNTPDMEGCKNLLSKNPSSGKILQAEYQNERVNNKETRESRKQEIQLKRSKGNI